jgi:protein TonB
MSAGDGPGGIAVPMSKPAEAPVVRQATKKVLAAAAPAPEDTCTDADVKAKGITIPHPAYTDEARAAGIEGKVRVELTLDATGQVTDAKVLEGLGHGLDEAALTAMRGAQFSPATHCGKPIATTFVVAVRFAL